MNWQEFLLDVTVKSFVLMALVAVMALLCRRSSAAMRHRIWTLGLCGTLVIPLITLLVPGFQIHILPTPSDSVAEMPLAALEPVDIVSNVDRAGEQLTVEYDQEATTALSVDAPKTSFAAEDMVSHSQFQPVSSTVPVNQAESQHRLAWSSWIVGAYSLIVVAFLTFCLGRWLKTHAWISGAQTIDDARIGGLVDDILHQWGSSTRVRLLHRVDLAMPCAAAIVRPVIILPSSALSWTDDRLQAVLMHELAHVVRRDMLTQSIAEVCRAVYWFNPLVWFAVAKLQLEREQACDDHVIRSGVVATDYARVLLEVAYDYRRSQRSVGLAMARPKELPRRIGSLLDKTRSHLAISRSRATMLLVAVAMISGVVSVLRPVSMAADAAAEDNSSDASKALVRGTDESLEIRLHGTVVDEAGEPVSDPELTLALHSTINNETMLARPEMHGNKFAFWLPASGQNWHGLSLEARGHDNGDEQAYQYLSREEIRAAAVGGVQVTLQKPTASTELIVTDHGELVAGASVKVEMTNGKPRRGKTNANGRLRISLMPGQKVFSVTAWTDNYRIGGYQFSRQPTRDANAPTHQIELASCRDQKIRMVDVDGNGIAGVEFEMLVATPAPYFNYLGIVDDANLMTNANGEAVFHWFPDWPEVHRYAELKSDQWYIQKEAKLVDDVLVITLKPHVQRKRVMGTVVGEESDRAGLAIESTSYQAEREDQFERRYATTDEKGRFWIDVLPGSTYSTFVADSVQVSNDADNLIYDSKANRTDPPQLHLIKGIRVTAKLTSGPDRTPMVNQSVGFRNQHRFQWTENGESRSGSGGRSFSAKTDREGVATAVMGPGKVKVSVYQNDWQANGFIDAADGADNFIAIHREISEPRKVTGRLVGAKDVDASFADCELTIGAIDGETRDERTLRVGADGTFAFETIATKLGVAAITDDRRYAGTMVARDVSKPMVVKMRPTESFHGKLTDADRNPVASRTITAYANLSDPDDTRASDPFGNISFPQSVRVMKTATTTDKNGDYAIDGLPSLVKITIYAEGQDWQLTEAYLRPNEVRPAVTTRLQRVGNDPATANKPIAQRWSGRLRDCRLGGYRALTVVTDGSDDAKKFIDEKLLDDEHRPVLSHFMETIFQPDIALTEFAAKMKWNKPSTGDIAIIVYDDAETELARTVVTIEDDTSIDRAIEFLHRQAPPAVDAEKAWDDAFALAKKTNRRVWARISGRYCGPCFTLARWLDDHRELLGKDFVMLKIDETAPADVQDRLTRRNSAGIPFHAIFAADGTEIIDSRGPLGNIGSPSGFEGKRHLRKMLESGCQNLTTEQIEKIVDSVND